MRYRLRVGVALFGAVALVLAACGSDDDDSAATTTSAPASDEAAPADEGGGERPTIVVTFPILGAAVEDLVGDTADVEVVMPNGVDLHGYQPSAQDAQRLNEADLIVANGANLEEGLLDVIAEAEASGVPVVEAMDYVQAREFDEAHSHEHGEGEAHSHEHGEGEAHSHEHGEGEAHSHEHGEDEAHSHEHGEGEAHSHGEDVAAESEHAHEDEAHSHEHSHDHGGEDPHFWTDPVAMQAAMVGLAAELESQLGLDLSEQEESLITAYEALDGEVQEIVEVVPPDSRRLVLGHESMGYFADRYGFELVGAIIPNVSTQAQVSAGELAELSGQVQELGVPAIFVDTGTPTDVADAIAAEVGAEVIVLPVNVLPDDGTYATFMTELAQAVAGGLAPQS